jgi:hypothetical protein
METNFMRQAIRLTFFGIVCTLLLWVLRPVPSLAQSSANSVVITDIDASQFPTIDVNIRVFDANNNAVRNLTTSSLTVYEEGQRVPEITLTEEERAPMVVMFVIDQGRYFSYQTVGESVIKRSLSTITDNRFFRDNYDTVAVLSRIADTNDQTVTLVNATQSSSAIINGINAISLANTERTDGLAGIESALTEIERLVTNAGEASAAIIYVGSIIDDSRGQRAAETGAESLAARAKAQKVKIHVLHTQARGDFADPLLALTSGSGGRYMRLQAEGSASNLNQLYQDVVNQGLQYRVTYNSQLSTSGTRNVAVAPAGVPLSAVSDQVRSYSVDVEAPTISLSVPREINRGGGRDSNDAITYRVDEVEVEATINWRNNLPREIVEADLVVDNITVLSLKPNVDNNRFKLTWDLRTFREEVRVVPVEVRIRDGLGVETVSRSTTVTINASVPPARTPTPAPPPPVAPPQPPPDPCLENSWSWACFTHFYANNISPWTNLILAVAVIILAIITYMNRSRVGQAAVQVGDKISEGVAIVTKTLVGGGGRKNRKVLARLTVDVGRRELVGEDIDVYTQQTRLGRNPKLCDIQLVDEDDISTVSGLHCTIQYDPAQDSFFLTDDNSANGTLLNGELLEANEPYVLSGGDTIILGEIARRGAKVRFYIPESVAEAAPVSIKTEVDSGGDSADDTIYDVDFDPTEVAGSDDLTEADDDWLKDL